MAGKFLIEHDLIDSALFNNVAAFRLYIFLIHKAVFTGDKQIGNIKIGRGQYLRAYRALQEDLVFQVGDRQKTYNLEAISEAVALLRDGGLIETQETIFGTLFTIINYEANQSFSGSKNQPISEFPNGDPNGDRNSIVAEKGNGSQNNISIGRTKGTNITKGTNSSCPNTKPQKRYNFSERDMKTAKMIWNGVLSIQPNRRTPIFEAWANTVRMMRQIDKRTHEQIELVFQKANKDSFWGQNILSPDNLRKHFDNLELKLIHSNKTPSKPGYINPNMPEKGKLIL